MKTQQGGPLEFSKHVAKALTSTEALATSPDLANEIETQITPAVHKGEPILMGPILA